MLNMGYMHVVNESTSLWPWLQVFIYNFLFYFFHSPFNARLRLAKVYSLRFCKCRFWRCPKSKIHWCCIRTFGHPFFRRYKVDFLLTQVRQYVFWGMTECTILVEDHVFNLVSRKHSGKIFIDKRLQNFI